MFLRASYGFQVFIVIILIQIYLCDHIFLLLDACRLLILIYYDIKIYIIYIIYIYVIFILSYKINMLRNCENPPKKKLFFRLFV